MLGVLAHKSNEGTYRTIFSTIMRITKGATLSSPCEDDDDGMDPLPKDLANATLYTCSGAGAKGVSGSPRDSQSMRLLNDQRTSEVTTNHD